MCNRVQALVLVELWVCIELLYQLLCILGVVLEVAVEIITY